MYKRRGHRTKPIAVDGVSSRDDSADPAHEPSLGEVRIRRRAQIDLADTARRNLVGIFVIDPDFGPGHGPKSAIGADLVSAAAKALGLTPAALIADLRKGDSLKDVASAQSKDYHAVSQAVHDAAKADLDKAVANGLDQARANELLSKLDAALAAGDFPHFGPRLGAGGFPWFRHDAANESPADAPAT